MLRGPCVCWWPLDHRTSARACSGIVCLAGGSANVLLFTFTHEQSATNDHVTESANTNANIATHEIAASLARFGAVKLVHTATTAVSLRLVGRIQVVFAAALFCAAQHILITIIFLAFL